MSPDDRSSLLRAASACIARMPRVVAAWCHGSFARGEPFRDLDIGVWFDGAPRWTEPGDLGWEVWVALGRPGFPVDIQVLNDATPAFRDRVTREGTLLHERAPGDALDVGVLARSLLPTPDRPAEVAPHPRGRPVRVRPERRAALRSALLDLHRYHGTFSRDTFLADTDAQRLVLHALYVAVQACGDEALEICRREGTGHDGSYRDAFLALGAARLLPAELSGQMASWASMPSVLAHVYPLLELARVWDALDDLEQLEAFEEWLLQRP